MATIFQTVNLGTNLIILIRNPTNSHPFCNFMSKNGDKYKP